MKPYEAYLYADTNHMEPGFDLKYCQEHACEDAGWACHFANDIPGADIEYCRKACENDKKWMNEFNKMIINKAML